VSSIGGPEMQATLLEDIESLHRNLKELESVKSYVRLIHHALALRCVSVLCNICLTNFHSLAKLLNVKREIFLRIHLSLNIVLSKPLWIL
jgi:hypothetical protein